MAIPTVENLVKELTKLDQKRNILIGDSDKYGRNDLMIASISRKKQGFDDDNEYYYVLSGAGCREGCIKY